MAFYEVCKVAYVLFRRLTYVTFRGMSTFPPESSPGCSASSGGSRLSGSIALPAQDLFAVRHELSLEAFILTSVGHEGVYERLEGVRHG